MASFGYDAARNRWRIVFTDKARKPAQKVITLRGQHYNKAEASALFKEINWLYLTKAFDPWKDDITRVISPHSKLRAFEKALNEYIHDRPKQIAPNTWQREKGRVNRLIKYIEVDDILRHPHKIKNWVYADGLSYSTMRNRLYAIKPLISFLASKGLLAYKPDEITQPLSKKRTALKSFDYLTHSEYKAFRRALVDKLISDNTLHFHSKQSKMYIELRPIAPYAYDICFYMGLRREEVQHFNTDLLSHDLKYYWINGRDYTDKAASKASDGMPVPTELHELLRKLKQMPNPIPFARISLEWLTKTFHKVIVSCFSEDRAIGLSFHCLRHSCAMYWVYERKKRVELVQRIMRHSSIQTTMIYLNHRPESLYNELNETGQYGSTKDPNGSINSN